MFVYVPNGADIQYFCRFVTMMSLHQRILKP